MALAIAELFVDVGGSTGKLESEMAKGAKALDNFTNKAKLAGTTLLKTTTPFSTFGKRLAGIGESAKRVGAQLSAVSIPIGLMSGAALKMAGNFEASMNKVSARGNIFGDDLDKLKNLALQLGADTQFSAQQAADGMADLAAAGFNTTQIMKAMPGVLDFAAASQLTVAEASQITVDTLGQFALKADSAGHVADVMTVAANSSQISMAQLAQSMKFVGPNAAAMGVSLENVTAMLALLGEAGINADQAGTSLRMGFARLIAPGAKAAATLQRMGIEATDATGKLKPLPELLKEFQQHASDPTFIGDMKTIFQTNSMTAWIAAAKLGGDELQRLENLTNNAGGAAKTQAAILRGGLNGALEQMRGSFETLGIALGTILEPAAIAVAGALQDLANIGIAAAAAFQKAPGPIKDVVSVLTGLLAIAGPAAFAIGALTSAFAVLTPVLAATQGAFLALLTTPFGAFFAAGAALIILGQQIYEHWGDIGPRLSAMWQVYVAEFNRTVAQLTALWDQLAAKIGNSNLFDTTNFSKGWTTFTSDFVGSMRTLMNGLDDFTGGWVSTMKSWSDAVMGMVSAVEEQITGRLVGIFNAIKAPIETATGWFKDMYDAVVGHSFVPDMIQGIGDWFGKLGTMMVGPAQSATTAVSGSMSSMASSVHSFGSEMQSTLTSVGEAFGLTGEQAQAASKLVGAFVSGLQSSQGFWSGFVQSISSQGGAGGGYGGGGSNYGGAARDALGRFSSSFGSGSSGPATASDGYYNPGGAPGSSGEGMGGGYSYSYGDVASAAGDIATMWKTDYEKQYGAKANQQKAHDIAQRTGVAIASIFSFGIPALIYKALGKEKFTKLEHALDPIGSRIVDKIEKSLFGQNEQTWARRQILRYLNDKLDKNALSNLPDASPAKTSGNINLGASNKFNQPGWADKFNASPGAGAFSAVGEGLTGLLGITEKVGGQVAAILSEQLGGSVDNLRVAMAGLGVTEQQMTDYFVQQAEKGTISWHEMEVSLQGVNDAFGKGLTEVGDYGKAFDQVINSGGQGMDAIMGLQNSAIEAGEAGITSFSQWSAALIASGKDAGYVATLMQALAQRGITSFDQLSNATTQQLGGVIADMESLSAPLSDMWHKAQESAQQYVDSVNQIESPKDVVLNVSANITPDAQQVLDATSGNGSQTTTTETPKKFAMGGIVNSPTAFSTSHGLGLMGEAGAEAIIPLTRVGGKLGVSMAGMQQGSGSTINIDARNADPGTEARLRHMFENLSDDLESRVLQRVMDEASRGGNFGNTFGY